MTPNEIRGKKFEKKMGGYRSEEVDAYLAEVANYLDILLDDKEELEAKIEILAEKVEEYREDEDSLRAALIGAQKLGDSVVRDAKNKAEMILNEATIKSERLVSDAKSNIDREAIALTKMQGQVAEFKTQILNMYKRHIEMISALPEEPNFPRDVRAIMEKAAKDSQKKKERERERDRAREKEQREAQEAKAERNPEDADEFALSFEEVEVEDEQTEEEEYRSSRARRGDAGKSSKRSEFGTLRFGEEYTLTRNDE